MKNNLFMEFTVDKETNTITVKREFAASIARVWDAFTKPELLDQWWAPKPWKARTKSMDFREGGTWLYAMVGPEGEEHWALAQYISIKPQRGFTVNDAFADAEGNINTELPQSNWVSDFSSVENGCLVVSTITYPSLEDLEAILKMGFKEGLLMAMDGLDTLLASNKS